MIDGVRRRRRRHGWHRERSHRTAGFPGRVRRRCRSVSTDPFARKFARWFARLSPRVLRRRLLRRTPGARVTRLGSTPDPHRPSSAPSLRGPGRGISGNDDGRVVASFGGETWNRDPDVRSGRTARPLADARSPRRFHRSPREGCRLRGAGVRDPGSSRGRTTARRPLQMAILRSVDRCDRDPPRHPFRPGDHSGSSRGRHRGGLVRSTDRPVRMPVGSGAASEGDRVGSTSSGTA